MSKARIGDFEIIRRIDRPGNLAPLFVCSWVADRWKLLDLLDPPARNLQNLFLAQQVNEDEDPPRSWLIVPILLEDLPKVGGSRLAWFIHNARFVLRVLLAEEGPKMIPVYGI